MTKKQYRMGVYKTPIKLGNLVLTDSQTVVLDMRSYPRGKDRIGVYGCSFDHYAPQDISKKKEIDKKAYQTGKVIAAEEAILFNGGLPQGYPYEAAKGARASNGYCIGVHPQSYEYIKEKEPQILEVHNVLICLNIGYHSHTDRLFRDLYNGLLVGKGKEETSEIKGGIIVIGGNSGTNHEIAFLIAQHENVPIGLLTGTGGVADNAKSYYEKIIGHSDLCVFESNDPATLVEFIRQEVGQRKLGEQAKLQNGLDPNDLLESLIIELEKEMFKK